MAKQVALVAQRCEEACANGSLDLSDCDLTKVPEGIFMLTKSVKVTCLDLSRNKLRRLLPKMASAYPELTALRLCQNFLLDLPQSLEQLSSLQHLDLSWNSLQHIPAVIFRLTAIETLNLQQNQITKVPMKELKALKNLKVLHLEKNPLEEEASRQLAEYSSDNHIKIYF